MPTSHRPRVMPLVHQAGLLLGLWLLLGTPAAAYQQLVVFGDSLSDPGNAFALSGEQARKPYELIPSAAYARGGHHFSNGRTWIEQLAGLLAMPHPGPAFRSPAFRNYAVGGSRARAGASPVDLSSQVGAWLGSPPAAIEDTLFVIFIGSNDVRDAILAGASNPADATRILSDALTAIADNLQALYAAGARHVLVANAPDLGQVPAIRLAADPGLQAGATLLSVQFNTALAGLLDSLEVMLPGLGITRLDIFGILTAIVRDPAGNGLANIDEPCIISDALRKAACSRPDDYLFWDGIHPTRAGHALLARAARAVLVRP